MFFKDRILTGWGNIPKSSTSIAKCGSVEDVKSALQYEKIIARGMGRSFADQTTNHQNFTLQFTSLDRFLHFDDNTGLLECESGVSFAKIIRYMTPKGWFPFISPGTKFITVGGAIANDVHGKGHHLDGSFINCVESFKIMLADGKIAEASRTKNADLFYANFGGMGLLGFIISATIRLRRINTTYFSKIIIKAHHLDEMLEQLNRRDQDYAFFSGWIDAKAKEDQIGKGLLAMSNFAQVDELPFKKMINPLHVKRNYGRTLPTLFSNLAYRNFVVRSSNKLWYYYRRSQSGIVDYNHFFFPMDLFKNWNKIYRKYGLIQYQLVIPFEEVNENLKNILRIISKSEHYPLSAEIKKFGKCESGPLSFPTEGYSLAVVFPIRDGLKDLLQTLSEAVVESKGRVYLSNDAYLLPEDFKKMYPLYNSWQEIKEKYDPGNKFSSDLSRRIGLTL